MFFRVKRNCLFALLVIALIGVCALFFPADNGTAVLANAEEEKIDLPIVMYHSMLKDKDLHGQFVISPDAFEEDLKNLTQMGFETIVVEDLLNYVYKDKPLPKKPIMLTCDDGYYNSYIYAYPLLKKYNCKMVLSPIGYYTDQYSESLELVASYSHCTWDNLKEMMDSGYVELQNHTYNLHSSNQGRLGVRQKQGESDSSYRELVVKDITKAQNCFRDKLKYTPTAFCYPYGAYSKSTISIIKELGFKCTFICDTKINTITKDKESLFGLCRFLRASKDNSKEFFTKLNTN